MLCQDVMKRNVTHVLDTETVQTAARHMRDHNIGFLPVLDASGKVVGTLTDRDVALRLVADNRPATLRVAEVMTREVVHCRPEDDIGTAEQHMMRHHKSRIVCLDHAEHLVGVISLSDIAEREEGVRAVEILRGVAEREVHIH